MWTTPKTWTVGEVVTAANMNLHVRDNLLALTIGARVTHSTSQTIANSTVTALALDTETFDTDTIHDTATNNSRLTCKTAGKYLIYGQVEFAGSTVNQRQAYLRLNGATDICFDERDGLAAGVDPTPVQVVTTYELAVNDYVQLMVWQNSGGNLDVTKTGVRTPVFGMTRISA